MGPFYYNKLKNHRIKNIALGGLSASLTIAALYSFSLVWEKGANITVFHAATVSLLYFGVLLVFSSAKFGQVIKVIDEKTFATYYELGNYKFKYKVFPRPAQVLLEQDRDRYYCLAIRPSAGQGLILERHPTLKQANERLEELKTIIS